MRRTQSNRSSSLCIAGLGVFFAISGFTQDPHFSQLYASPLYLNPALAGGSCPRLSLSSRVQWPMLTAPYRTHYLAVDGDAPKFMGAWGLMAFYDDAGLGVVKTSSIAASYTYRTELTGTKNANYQTWLRAGFQAGFQNKALNAALLSSRDQIDTIGWSGFTLPGVDRPQVGSVFYPDFSSGVVLSTSRRGKHVLEAGFIGFAIHHLNTPNESFSASEGGSPLPMRTTIQGGMTIHTRWNRNRTAPNHVMVNGIWMAQNDIRQLNVGAYLDYKPFLIGLWYRSRDAVIISSALVIDRGNGGSDSFGVSYDFTTSKLGPRTFGAIEVTYQRIWACGSRFRGWPCPWDPYQRMLHHRNKYKV